MSTPKRSGRFDVSGFTLVELVIVIVVIGILAAYAAFSASPSELSIPSQAETMASNIRYLQATANAGKRTRLEVSATGYTGVACTSDDCSTSSPVFTIPFDKDIQIISGAGTIFFDTLGRPTTGPTGYTAASASYVIGGQKTVAVAEATGYVTVTVTVTP